MIPLPAPFEQHCPLRQRAGWLRAGKLLAGVVLAFWGSVFGAFGQEAKDAALAEATNLNDQVFEFYKQGQYKKALPLAEKALAIREKLLGPEHPDTALSLANVAAQFRALADYPKAEPLFVRALAIREKLLGPEHPDTANSLHSLASLYNAMGEYSKAEPLYARALAIREKALDAAGVDSRDAALERARILSSQAFVFWKHQQYEKAIPLNEKSLEIREKLLGPEHPDTAMGLFNLGAQFHGLADFARAEPLFRRALAIQEKVLGPDHPDTALSVNELTVFYQEFGDYAQAEPLARRALAIREKVLGPEHPDTATSLGNLAAIQLHLGEYAQAEKLYQRALEIDDKVLGSEHPETADCLANLARLFETAGDYAKAESVALRMLAICEKALGTEHSKTATALAILAGLYHTLGEYAKAEPLYRRSLATEEKVRGPEHPDIAGTLNNLAELYRALGNYPEAESLHRRALAIRERLLGPEHENTSSSLGNLATLYAAMHERGKAHDYGARAIAVEQTNLGRILSFASERQRLAFQRASVRFHLVAATGTPREIATTILRWKAVVMDSVMEDRVVARQAGEGGLRERLDSMRSLKGRLMKLAVEVPHVFGAEARKNREQAMARLEQELAAIEGEMARKVSALGRSRRALGVTVEQVQQALGPREALLEFVSYSTDLGNARREWRYGVVVLTARDEPQWVPLGWTAEIDLAADLYQKSVRGKTDETTLERSLQSLSELVWAPVERVLPEQTESVVISPDGSLSFVSFATLLDDQERFLGERYAVRYVGSGRDLLRPRPPAPAKELALYGNADFGAGASQDSAPAASELTVALRSAEVRDFGKLLLSPLPGTAQECRGVGVLASAAGWTVQSHFGAAATESALVRESRPGILHLATHGFFLAEEKVQNDKPDLAFAEEQTNPLLVNPMHRSGVALSGAQRTLEAWRARKAPAPENDGILTADEVAGLDLEGTWLVTLSACETGIGEARSGEGVLGLRRAFVQAGAGNLLMTLWPVNDQTTAEIMEDFYRRALAFGDAPQALVETQREWLLKLRKEKGLLHAVNRAGPFILSSLGSSLPATR